MRIGVVAAGGVVIAIGLVIAGLSVLANSESTVIPDPRAGQLTIQSRVLWGGTVTLTWSGANSQFSFTINPCTDSSCGQWGASSVRGSGPSGSVSFSIAGGASYVVLAAGNTIAVPATIAFSGLTLLLLIGIIFEAAGGGIAVIGYVARPKPRAAAPTVAPPPVARTGLPRPISDGSVQAASTSYPAPQAKPEPAGPVFFQPSGPEELYGADQTAPTAAAPPQGPRPSILCHACGTWNEPWLHNCRSCHRALESTGG